MMPLASIPTQQREFWSVRNVPRKEPNFYMDPDIRNDCLSILKKMTKVQNAANLFSVPVDTTIYTTYLSIIKHPMDFQTIRKNLKSGVYEETANFADDMRTVWMNCEVFNMPNDQYSNTGKRCSEVFERFWAALLKRLDKMVQKEEDDTGVRQPAPGSGQSTQISLPVAKASPSPSLHASQGAPPGASPNGDSVHLQFPTSAAPASSPTNSVASLEAQKREFEESKRKLAEEQRLFLEQKRLMEKQQKEMDEKRKEKERLELRDQLRAKHAAAAPPPTGGKGKGIPATATPVANSTSDLSSGLDSAASGLKRSRSPGENGLPVGSTPKIPKLETETPPPDQHISSEAEPSSVLGQEDTHARMDTNTTVSSHSTDSH
eukprot:186535_1